MSQLVFKSISNKKLNNRIKLNSKFQKFNFISWQEKNYKKILKKFKIPKKNISILDLGCGTGIQVDFFNRYFFNPNIVATDLSRNSIMQAKKKFKGKKFILSNMDDFFKNNNKFKYDVIHSSYAFYYSKNPLNLLKKCYSNLKVNGCIIIACPMKKHEMVEFVMKYGHVNKKVLKTLELYEKVLKPFLKLKIKLIRKIIFKKVNKISFNNTQDFLNFWQNTTYYDNRYRNKLESKLNIKASLQFKKGTQIISLKKISSK
jgi:tRNA (cmo5U34)-methyltransferase